VILLAQIAFIALLSVARNAWLGLITTKANAHNVRISLGVLLKMVVVEKQAVSNAKKVTILTKTMNVVYAVVLFQAALSATLRLNAPSVLVICLNHRMVSVLVTRICPMHPITMKALVSVMMAII